MTTPERLFTVLPEPDEGGGGMSTMFGALRQPDFRWWFASQVLAASGTTTAAIALSWLVLRLTGSAVDLAVLSICALGPMLLLGPWAGVLVDRADRRTMLIRTQILLLTLSLALAALTATGTIRLWSVFVLSLLTGMVGVVVDLVGTSGVASAVGLNEVVINASRVLGPAVGGVLLATVGTPACFVVNAGSFLASLLVLLRDRKPAAGHVETAQRESRAIRVGLRYVAHAPAIRACVLLAAAAGMLFNLGVALPVLTTRTLHLGGGGFALLMAVFGVGALPGAALAAATSAPGGRLVRLLATLTGVAVILVGYAPGIVTACIGMAVAGCVSIWFIAAANTLVLLDSVNSLRGRVMSVWNMALPGTLPLTGLITAWIDQTVGSRAGFAASGVALLLTVAVGWTALGRHRSRQTSVPSGS
jgi:hypothetical protein